MRRPLPFQGGRAGGGFPGAGAGTGVKRRGLGTRWKKDKTAYVPTRQEGMRWKDSVGVPSPPRNKCGNGTWAVCCGRRQVGGEPVAAVQCRMHAYRPQFQPFMLFHELRLPGWKSAHRPLPFQGGRVGGGFPGAGTGVKRRTGYTVEERQNGVCLRAGGREEVEGKRRRHPQNKCGERHVGGVLRETAGWRGGCRDRAVLKSRRSCKCGASAARSSDVQI